MRLFLILLLGCMPFFASSQVVISNEVADYYLELDDKFHILEFKVKTLEKVAAECHKQNITSKLLIVNSDVNTSVYEGIIATKGSELAFKDKELKLSKKEIRKQKFLKVVTMVGGAVIVILILI